MPSERFEDLVVWQKAHVFVLEVYKFAKGFPKEERYGLTSQLQRSVVSVPANIAEGFRRKSKADKVRFYNIAQASNEEARYYLILARDLEYGDSSELLDKSDEVSRLLRAYANSVRASEEEG